VLFVRIDSEQGDSVNYAERTADAVSFGQGIGTLACVGYATKPDLRFVYRRIAE